MTRTIHNLPAEVHVMMRMEENSVNKGHAKHDIDDADDQPGGSHAFAVDVTTAAHAAVRDGCER